MPESAIGAGIREARVEQAVRPDFEITGRADMECGGAFRRRVLYLLAIPRNGPLLILRLN